jgi:uncharacterized repeat protein (TIGR03803 family)
MSTRLRHANSTSGKLLRAPANALLMMLALGTAAALHAQQSADKSLAGTYNLLYSFQCSPDGAYPEAGLVRDSSGNLYGTTFNGGQYGNGTVFKVTSSGSESVLHSFAGPRSDGEDPIGSLTLDAAGNVYGTTESGGEFGGGTVYKLTATGTERVLYNFCSQSLCTDGNGPLGGIVRDSAGELYGTTNWGGTSNEGVVFELTAGGTESVLHNFLGSPIDGTNPYSNLNRDSSGNLYGTTFTGGASGVGTIFEVTAGGTESLLYSFKGSPLDGGYPGFGGLVRDASGNFYGVTEGGGAEGFGSVFELTSEGTESVLLSFDGGPGGGYPYDGLARDAAGNLFGTATVGGSGTDCDFDGCGVLFGLPSGGEEIVAHDFGLSSSGDGTIPFGGVLRDPSGNLYGTLSEGGAYGCGAVFKFTP